MDERPETVLTPVIQGTQSPLRRSAAQLRQRYLSLRSLLVQPRHFHQMPFIQAGAPCWQRHAR